MAQTFGYSKYLKGIVDTLSSTFNAYVVSNDAYVADLSANLATEVANRQTAVSDLSSSVFTALATEVSNRETAVSDLSSAVFTALATKESELTSAIQAVEASFNTWVATNTDEIANEVDKAINLKVNQSAYDAVVAQLQSDISNNESAISQAIVERLGADATHDVKLNKLYNFVSLLLETYHLEDASGNVITTADVMSDAYTFA